MPRLDAYLFFDGNCAEVMRFYEKTLGGTLRMMTYGEMPGGQIPPGSEKSVMHARLELGEGVLMASDAVMGPPCGKLNAASLSLAYDSVPDAKRVFEALAAGGSVTMPFDKTFWAEGFGMCTDRYGTAWMVNGGMSPGAGLK